jgi:hypothetical protein
MRLRRSTGAFSGLLIVLLGLWGALIPFVGPYFDYSFSTNTTWHYTTDRLWLDIIPGAVAVLGGLLLLTSNTRMRGALGGWLATIAGAWFVIGPAVSITWEQGRGPIGPPLGGTTRQALELIGYFYGLGALIVALAAFAVGRFASRPHLAAEEAAVGAPTRAAPAGARAATATPADARAATATPADARPATATPAAPAAREHRPRRRGLPFRRGRTTAPPRGGRAA